MSNDLRDSTKHMGLRKQLADELKQKGINDNRVLEAIRRVPRHIFIDSLLEEHAYQDKALPIAANQTISAPYTVAFQTQLLHIEPMEKVLEIGTGSGYQTAILVEMGAWVYTMERQKELYEFSRKTLKELRRIPKYQTFGDGFKGLPTFAPFDKIIVTCGAAKMPKELLNQLKVGGIMVIPMGKATEQQLFSILKLSENEFEQNCHGDCAFVPMLKNKVV